MKVFRPTKAQLLVASFLVDGYTVSRQRSTGKYVAMEAGVTMKHRDTLFFIGRCGALRIGKMASKSRDSEGNFHRLVEQHGETAISTGKLDAQSVIDAIQTSGVKWAR